MSLAGKVHMKGADRAQQSSVDAVLRAVERTLTAQQEVRQGIRAGRIRVDDLLREALAKDAPAR